MPNDWRKLLSQKWRAIASGPFFDLAAPPAEFTSTLPNEYLAAAAEFGGREGFLGDTYLRLYRLNELIALNVSYAVPAWLPQVVVFGSNGIGEAFAFQLGEAAVIQVPFLPLSSEYIEQKGKDFTDFLRKLASAGESIEQNPDTVGMEIHDKHPICLGGSPTDPENKVIVPAAKHAEICSFWNKVYSRIRAQQIDKP